MRFEYLTLTCDRNTGDWVTQDGSLRANGNLRATRLETALNVLGADRWELCGQHGPTLIFKRPVEERAAAPAAKSAAARKGR